MRMYYTNQEPTDADVKWFQITMFFAYT